MNKIMISPETITAMQQSTIDLQNDVLKLKKAIVVLETKPSNGMTYIKQLNSVESRIASKFGGIREELDALDTQVQQLRDKKEKTFLERLFKV